MSKHGNRYLIKEIFYSIQGEGVQAGRAAVFVRFSGCNLKCRKEQQGFDCDTDFSDGEELTLDEVEQRIWEELKEHGHEEWPNELFIVFTGGEPALQLDEHMIRQLSRPGVFLAIETNGTLPLPSGLDWICVSPKRGTKIVVTEADEVKYVLSDGQLPFEVPTKAKHWIVSPAAEGNKLVRDNIAWCPWA